jgi:RNA polymerase sigma factor (sigma-70 family)
MKSGLALNITQTHHHRINNVQPSKNNIADKVELTQSIQAVALYRDKQAFGRLFVFFAPKIKRVAFSKLNSEPQAMDAVQQILTQVWQKAHLYDPDKGEITSWVYAIMRNVIFDALRKIKTADSSPLSNDIWHTEDLLVSEQLVFGDHLQQRHLKRCVDQLPVAQKQVVQALYFQQMSHQQLAEQLNVPVGTVKSRLRLALVRLKQQMEDSND